MENVSNHDPDQEILAYFRSTYSNEYRADLTNSLAVLYEAEYQDIQENLVNTLNGPEADDPEVLSKVMDGLIVKAMDRLFELQGIEIDPETPLSLKNMIATTLLLVVAVEDPVPYLRILETDLSPVEKLARLTESFTTANEIAVLDAVQSVSDSTLSRLYTELEKQEARQVDPQPEQASDKQLEHFKKFCAYVGKDHIGYQMLQNNFKFGLSSKTYYPYVSSYLQGEDHTLTAKNILSYYLLAADTWESPIECFRRDSEILLTHSRDILPVETQMRKILEGLEQYKRTLNESV